MNRLALRKHNAKCTTPNLAPTNPWAKVMGPPPMPKPPPPQVQTSPANSNIGSSSFLNMESDPNAPSPQLDASMFGAGASGGPGNGNEGQKEFQNGIGTAGGGSSAASLNAAQLQGISTSSSTNHENVDENVTENAPGSSAVSPSPRFTQSGTTPTNFTQASSLLLLETPKFTGPNHQPIATSTPNLHPNPPAPPLDRANSSPNGPFFSPASAFATVIESPTFLGPPHSSLLGSYDFSSAHNGLGNGIDRFVAVSLLLFNFLNKSRCWDPEIFEFQIFF